jgi:glycosyltransferase involved in cell wall biosynthesis
LILNKNKIVVIIPAFNEAETIFNVINEIHGLGFEVIVVDNGSNDKTLEIAKEQKAITFSHQENKGYESALNTGIHISIKKGFDFAITYDADDQFNPKDLIMYVNHQEKNNADVVVGIRNYRNRFSEYLLVLYGKLRYNLSDPLCGMKLYRLDMVKNHLPFDSFKLVGMEMVFRLIDEGCNFVQLPIKIKKRKNPSRFGASFSGEIAILRSLVRAIRIFGFFKK